jgi:hypothetical protein
MLLKPPLRKVQQDLRQSSHREWNLYPRAACRMKASAFHPVRSQMCPRYPFRRTSEANERLRSSLTTRKTFIVTSVLIPMLRTPIARYLRPHPLSRNVLLLSRVLPRLELSAHLRFRKFRKRSAGTSIINTVAEAISLHKCPVAR